MRRDQNNPLPSSQNNFDLPKSGILRGRKNFQRLFERDVTILRNTCVDLRYKVFDSPDYGCMMGFIAKRSLGKAHKRNRIKRLLKESYRLNQHMLTDTIDNLQLGFHGVLMARSADADFPAIEQNVKALLKQVKNHLSTISGTDS